MSDSTDTGHCSAALLCTGAVFWRALFAEISGQCEADCARPQGLWSINESDAL